MSSELDAQAVNIIMYMDVEAATLGATPKASYTGLKKNPPPIPNELPMNDAKKAPRMI
jgi:hypothetical protein